MSSALSPQRAKATATAAASAASADPASRTSSPAPLTSSSPSSSVASLYRNWSTAMSSPELRPFMYLPSLAVLDFAFAVRTASQAQFIIQKVCLSHYLSRGTSLLPLPNDSIKCDAPEVQKEIAEFNANCLAMILVPSLFTSIIVGYSSDIIGRKPIISMVAFAMLFAMVTPYFVVSFDLPYQAFYLPDLLLGLVGGFAAIGSVGFSSLVDLTTTANRTRVIGTYSGVMVCVSLTAVAVGGVVTGNPSVGHLEAFLPVFRLSAILGVIGVMALVFGTTETLPTKSAPTKSSIKTIVSTPVTILKKSWPALSRIPLAILALQIVLAAGSFRYSFDTQLSNLRFGWGTRDTSIFGFVERIVGGILSGVLLPTLEGVLRRIFNRDALKTSAGAEAEAGAYPQALETSPLLGGAAGSPSSSSSSSGPAPAVDVEDAKSNVLHEDEQRKVTVKIHTTLVRFTLFGSLIGALIFATAKKGWMWFAGLPFIGLTGITSTCIRLTISEFVTPAQMALTNSIVGFIDTVVILFSTRLAAFLYPDYYFLSAAVFALDLAISLIVKVRPPPPNEAVSFSESSPSPSATSSSENSGEAVHSA
ncbi:hypothetical protein DFJ73DRAFT_860322 [Zopfochytrium polystomum]|nr:hypothetical protein DFJ73DRAFT_860322 [Zopfochytrium polystomum]